MFGPLSVIAILAGPLWLFKEWVKDENKYHDAHHRYDGETDYVNELVDRGLELKIKKYVETSLEKRENLDEIYDRLEDFKRCNPMHCTKLFLDQELILRSIQYPKYDKMDSLNWYTVGVKRVGYDSIDEDILTDMLVNSCGVMSVRQATAKFRRDRDKKYQLIKEQMRMKHD